MGVRYYVNVILEKDSDIEKSRKMLFEALMKSGNLVSDKIDEIGQYYIYDNKDREKGAGAFKIKTAKSGEIFEEPLVGFHFETSNHGYYEILIESIADKIAEIDPACAYGVGDNDEISNLEVCAFEYYRDPYDFCIVPYLKNYQISRKWFPGFKSHEFLRDKSLAKIKKNYKKKLSRKDLISIIKEHSEKVWLGKRGVGADGKEIGPRYWIRKRLRELGFKIKSDVPEKRAIYWNVDPEGTKWIKKEDFEKKDELKEKSEEKQGKKKSFFSKILGKFRKEK
ncbi:MAG: hypothetical protein HYW26_06115 [Candidatus Aenigmarchaeota archaeon]|nr:hypothetical protein [Candidatus Aenigmarchaeota archaeon]